MKHVYRIETHDKLGPYVDGGGCYKLKVALGDEPRRHPNAWNDGGLAKTWERLTKDDLHRGYRFCFASLDQLKAWFYDSEWLVGLGDLGYVMAVYNVADPAVHVGWAQAIFHGTYHTDKDRVAVYDLEQVANDLIDVV